MEPRPIEWGKAHSLHFRQQVALEVERAKEQVPRQTTLESIAQKYGIDRKTAWKYHKLYVSDKLNNVDYADRTLVQSSVLRPLARKAKVVDETNGELTFQHRHRQTRLEKAFGDKKDAVLQLLASIQLSAPQLTAEDIVYFERLSRSNQRHVGAEQVWGPLEKMQSEVEHPNDPTKMVTAIELLHELKGILTSLPDKPHIDAKDVVVARRRHELSFKVLNYDHVEKDNEAVQLAKKNFVKFQGHIYAEDCVFVDEFSVVMNMSLPRGWAKKGEMPYIRKREQSDSRTEVLAAMKWPDDDKKGPCFFLRIFPPIPGRIANQNPLLDSPSMAPVAETLQNKVWWKGVCLIVGDWCYRTGGDERRAKHEILLHRLSDALSGLASHEFFVDLFANGTLPRASQVVANVDKIRFWVRGKNSDELELDGEKVSCLTMRREFWESMEEEGFLDKSKNATFTPVLSIVPLRGRGDGDGDDGGEGEHELSEEERTERIQFVLRLAAHDFAFSSFFNEHNYSIDSLRYGEDLSDPTWMDGGNPDWNVATMTKEKAEDARTSGLTFDNSGRGDMAEDAEDGVQSALDFLVSAMKHKSYKEMFVALFSDDVTLPLRRELDKGYKSRAHDLYSREYAALWTSDPGANRRKQTARNRGLVHAIFKSINIGVRVPKSSNTFVYLKPYEMVCQLWKIVHIFEGDKSLLGEPRYIPERQGEGYTYEKSDNVLVADPHYNGDHFPVNFRDIVSGLKKRGSEVTKSYETKERVPEIRLLNSQRRESNLGSSPFTPNSSYFKMFLKSLPPSFVNGKTIIMDGASYHSPPTASELGKNKALPDASRVFPIGELSENARMLRGRGAGDGLLLPPTENSWQSRSLALVFTPPYSPEFNPIELAFNVGKHYVRQQTSRNKRSRKNLSIAIINAFHQHIRPHAVKNFILCSGFSSVERMVRHVDGKRRGCTARFVEGKFPDPSKPAKTSNQVHDYRNPEMKDVADYEADPEASPRLMLERYPKLTLCPPDARDARIVADGAACRKRSAKEYAQGDLVRYHTGRSGATDENTRWRRAEVVAVPTPTDHPRADPSFTKFPYGVMHNPWIRIKDLETGKELPCMVSHLRPDSSVLRRLRDETTRVQTEIRNAEQKIVESRENDRIDFMNQELQKTQDKVREAGERQVKKFSTQQRKAIKDYDKTVQEEGEKALVVRLDGIRRSRVTHLPTVYAEFF